VPLENVFSVFDRLRICIRRSIGTGTELHAVEQINAIQASEGEGSFLGKLYLIRVIQVSIVCLI